MLLTDLLQASAAKFPDKWAAIFPSERITFRDLDERSNQVAARLRSLGIGPKDRVALLYDNAPAALVYFWGVLKSGAETTDLPAQAGPRAINEVLEECAPKALVIQPKLLQKLAQDHPRPALPEILLTTRSPEVFSLEPGSRVLALEDIAEEEDRRTIRPEVDEHQVAMIVYTSGTTGRSKGVMLSHHNLISNLTAANSLVGLTSEHSILVVVPFYFIHGRMQILAHALTGGTIVVSAGFQFPPTVLEEIITHRVSGVSGVPYHFIMLMERTKLKGTALPDLKYVLVTGGALSQSALENLRDALPGVQLHSAYGQTEASPRITYLGPKEIFVKKGSAGRPLPGIRVEILDEEGSALPAGSIGEVVAAGPNIMKGYVSGDERASGRIDDQGRLRTGDLGYLDADGHLFVVGRKSEMIKTAGERIFPKEIEDVLNAHPAVRESAVIGVADETLGERIVAFAVLNEGHQLSLGDLRNHCLKSMAFVRIPRELRIVERLPKTASAKINRSELQALYSAKKEEPAPP